MASAIAAEASAFEGFQLLGLKDRIENIFWDRVAEAFRWPFAVAALAALLAVIPGALLPRRLP